MGEESLSDVNGGTDNFESLQTTVCMDNDPVLVPPSHFPQPEAPPGSTDSPAHEEASAAAIDVLSIGKYLRDRGSIVSTAIANGIFSSLRDSDHVTEFDLSGLEVIVQLKDNSAAWSEGRITFFSRSGCRDCGAVRFFLRHRGLAYVEINLDVFPEKEKEMVDRTGGTTSVPQIFFNEQLIGGLEALNSLRNSGEVEKRLREMAADRCAESAPPIPAGRVSDGKDKDENTADGMIGVVRVLRTRVPIQDRISKMRIVRKCFAGSDMVETLIVYLDCDRKKAVEIGKELERKHFIHHVFRVNEFEDSNYQFYRFLEHDPVIFKCFNFIGSPNDDEPKSASSVAQKLNKLMTAILEAYASEDRLHLDHANIGSSEEFRRYVDFVQDLQRVDIFTLSEDERLAFFLNLYNAMVIDAVVRTGRPGVIDRGSFNDFHYIIGGYPYSISTIKNGILRSNRRHPYSIVKPFSAGDKRLEVALPKVNPLIHFGLSNGTRSCPAVRFFSPQCVDVELRQAARAFFTKGGMEVDLENRIVHLTRIIKWYNVDFGHGKDVLNWILDYLDAHKAGLLTHLLNDGGPINISYQNFDWSLNC